MDDYDFSDYDFSDYYDPSYYSQDYAPVDDYASYMDDSSVMPDMYYQQDMGGDVPQEVYPDVYYQQDFGGESAPTQEEINQILSGTGGTDKYSFKADYGAPTQDKLGFRATLDESAPGYAIEPKTPYGVDEETGTGMQMPTAPNLTSMGGGQGLTLDIPAEYDSEGNLIPGTGGVLTEKGFVPGDAQRVLGDPRSYINNPTITGKTQVTNDSIKNPIKTVNTNDIKTFVDQVKKSIGNDKIITDRFSDKSITNKTTNPLQNLLNKVTGKGNQKDMMSLLPLLLAMMAANKQQAPATTIPSLGASRSQLPYSPPRPGEKNISYFSPVTYRAAGGIVSLADGGLTAAQQAYYARLPQDREQYNYVKGLSDYQSLASLDALGPKPSVREFMDKTGADFHTASNILYGVAGANPDTRNFQNIMAEKDPVSAARQATADMYGGIKTITRTNPVTKETYPYLTSSTGVPLTMAGSMDKDFGVGLTANPNSSFISGPAPARIPTNISGYDQAALLAQRYGIKGPVSFGAEGGITASAEGGYNLGGYSDGGRLLKGPGDGVSDDIPATIGGKQPARLADGEFVVPARIVSELGNGSTDAGARKLYDMMKRVEQTRKKGKHIAQDTKADKHLPA